jgi:hypothetical protein
MAGLFLPNFFDSMYFGCHMSIRFLRTQNYRF